MDSYTECLQAMYALRRFGIKLGLATIRSILKGLGNPQDGFKCVHVAGTNGKGSVAASLASILHEAGHRVGLYTSPHLVRFNERICINQRQISNDDVVAAYRAVKRVLSGSREPTFFELTTAIAFYEFGEKKVDWAVVETGMGGRLDATNIIKAALAIITNISLEHREYLGNTLALIAREKAGIIKRKTPVITGIRQKQALAAVKAIAAAKSAPLFILGRHFRTRRRSFGGFSYFGINTDWPDLHTALAGDYQVDNAALVLAAVELLNPKGAAITFPCIQRGFANTRWPGRLQTVCRDPLIILDGAHNLSAARNLAGYLAKELSDRRITLVVGILSDKPYAAMLKRLLPSCTRAVLTQAKIDRALAPEKLHAVARKQLADITIVSEVAEAVKFAVESARPGEAVCIAGSLYVVGEALEAIEKGLIPRAGR
jgi:dihydrofolate synthase/folylpolyglutamate synthase